MIGEFQNVTSICVAYTYNQTRLKRQAVALFKAKAKAKAKAKVKAKAKAKAKAEDDTMDANTLRAFLTELNVSDEGASRLLADSNVGLEGGVLTEAQFVEWYDAHENAETFNGLSLALRNSIENMEDEQTDPHWDLYTKHMRDTFPPERVIAWCLPDSKTLARGGQFYNTSMNPALIRGTEYLENSVTKYEISNLDGVRGHDIYIGYPFKTLCDFDFEKTYPKASEFNETFMQEYERIKSDSLDCTVIVMAFHQYTAQRFLFNFTSEYSSRRYTNNDGKDTYPRLGNCGMFLIKDQTLTIIYAGEDAKGASKNDLQENQTFTLQHTFDKPTICVRHGQSYHNVSSDGEKTVNPLDFYNSPLTPFGITQAVNAARLNFEILRDTHHINFQHCVLWSSVLTRALLTGMICVDTWMNNGISTWDVSQTLKTNVAKMDTTTPTLFHKLINYTALRLSPLIESRKIKDQVTKNSSTDFPPSGSHTAESFRVYLSITLRERAKWDLSPSSIRRFLGRKGSNRSIGKWVAPENLISAEETKLQELLDEETDVRYF